MAKLTLNDVGSLIDATTAQNTINVNNALIEAAMEKTYTRDGTTPNTMTADLDMNSKQILNLPSPGNPNSPLRLQDLTSFVGGGTIQTIPAGGTTNQLLRKTSNANYDVSYTGDLAVNTYNKISITTPATGATLTIPDGVTLTGPAASGTAMTLGNAETVTGAKTYGATGNVGKLKVAGTTSGSTTLDATAVASGTLTLPAATDTLVGRATTDTLTNKTLTDAVANTQAPGDNTTKVANTAFVAAALGTAAWNSWTPTLSSITGTFTSAVVTGKYTQIGKIVVFRAKVVVTTNGTAAGGFIISLPVTSIINEGSVYGMARSSQKAQIGRFTTTNQFSANNYDGTFLATNDTFDFSGTYEAA